MRDAQNFGTTAVLWLWTYVTEDCVLSLSHRQEAAFSSMPQSLKLPCKLFGVHLTWAGEGYKQFSIDT